MIIVLKYPQLLVLFNRDVENVSEYSVLRNCLRKYLQNGKTVVLATEVIRPDFESKKDEAVDNPELYTI